MDANQNRREFKFVLPPHLGQIIRDRVAEVMQADRGAEDGYPVLSEYFDTDERTSYWQKQLGVPNRRRVRTRVYGRSDGTIPPSAFIEVKHKLDGMTVKRRVPVELDELKLLSKGELPALETSTCPNEQRVLAEINDLVNNRESRPVVQIRYHRYAFDSGPEGNIRITFDIEPSCRFRLLPLKPDDRDFEHPLVEPGESLMEVKTIGPVPYWFRNLIGEFNLVPRGFSKYAAALELYEFTKTADNLAESKVTAHELGTAQLLEESELVAGPATVDHAPAHARSQPRGSSVSPIRQYFSKILSLI